MVRRCGTLTNASQLIWLKMLTCQIDKQTLKDRTVVPDVPLAKSDRASVFSEIIIIVCVDT